MPSFGETFSVLFPLVTPEDFMQFSPNQVYALALFSSQLERFPDATLHVADDQQSRIRGWFFYHDNLALMYITRDFEFQNRMLDDLTVEEREELNL